MERDKLIRLAYLLGSDYTDGLAGVGPVVAMELLTEFQGIDGLHKFRDWWRKVQSGKDKQEESANKFRKRFVSPSPFFFCLTVTKWTELNTPSRKNVSKNSSCQRIGRTQRW